MTARDPNPEPAMTPQQHIREAEHILSDLSFRGNSGMPGVRHAGAVESIDSPRGSTIAEHLVDRAHLHLAIAQAQIAAASMPQDITLDPPPPVVSPAAAIPLNPMSSYDTMGRLMAARRFGFPRTPGNGLIYFGDDGSAWQWFAKRDEWVRVTDPYPANADAGRFRPGGTVKPLTGYDSMTAAFATEHFGFPVDDDMITVGTFKTDEDGCVWAYEVTNNEGTWQRRTYPDVADVGQSSLEHLGLERITDHGALDRMFAHTRFGFPNTPTHPAAHIDNEGGRWRFDQGNDRWLRTADVDPIGHYNTLTSIAAFEQFGFPSADYDKTHVDTDGAVWKYGPRPEEVAPDAAWHRQTGPRDPSTERNEGAANPLVAPCHYCKHTIHAHKRHPMDEDTGPCLHAGCDCTAWIPF